MCIACQRVPGFRSPHLLLQRPPREFLIQPWKCILPVTMGQRHVQPMELTYQVNPTKDLDMTKFSVSDTEAYNRKGSAKKRLQGVKGVTASSDYLPILAVKRKGSIDESSCRLIPMCLAVHGNPRDVTAKILLTTKAPKLTQAAGPPTLDILFQDQTKVRVGFQNIPCIEENKENRKNNAWMATSIHFGDESTPKYRIQITRQNFPFLMQIFDGQSNTTRVSILTYGAVHNQPRVIHAFHGNVTTSGKAKEQHISQLFAILDERDGLLAFQNALRHPEEKATFCVMLLLRTRMITVNGEW